MTKQKAVSVLTHLPVAQHRGLVRHTARVQIVLQAKLHRPVQFTEADGVRLIRWVSWSERLRVPLGWVVDKALQWGQEVASKKVKLRRRQNLFPLSIASLTGEMCRQWIFEQAVEESMRGATDELFRQRMVHDFIEAKDLHVARPRGRMLDFEDVESYTTAYSTKMRARREMRLLAETALAQSKPFPGNPFR